MTGLLTGLDARITELLAGWNWYTTVLTTILAALLVYPIFTSDEPDIHPLLLSRQSRSSPVRQPNESATYRALEIPTSYPLRSGLDIKDASSPRWKAGRDGDLRDIWRAVVQGSKDDGQSKVISVFGQQQLVEHDVVEISRDMAILGQYLQTAGARRVGICLPNSIEYLTSLFACVYHGIVPVLLPVGQSQAEIAALLQSPTAEIDTLIASAGSLSATDLAVSNPGIDRLVLVVEKTSREVGFTEPSADLSNKVTVAAWHDLVEDMTKRANAELPSVDSHAAVNVVLATFSPSLALIELPQKTLIAGTAGSLFALPARQRFAPSDLVLAADSFCSSFVLCQILAALFSHASVVINSIAGREVDLCLAARNTSPTVIVCSSDSLTQTHRQVSSTPTGAMATIARYLQHSALGSGRLGPDPLMSKFIDTRSSLLGQTPGKLRLLLASHDGGRKDRVLSSSTLHELRVYTGARICLALTAPQVAGAVAQTNIFDYRSHLGQQASHFGVPPPSIEFKLQNSNDNELECRNPRGELIARGPAVLGGEASLRIQATMNDDCTLSIA